MSWGANVANVTRVGESWKIKYMLDIQNVIFAIFFLEANAKYCLWGSKEIKG